MNLTTFSLVILVLSSYLTTIAQGTSDEVFYLEKSKKYKRMKNAGATLTIVGGVLAVVGFGTMVNSLDILAAEQTDRYKTGENLFVFGAIGIAPGIPLWIVGARNHRKYSRNSGSLSVNLNMNLQNKGLTLRYRF